jgi:hypothetical protein
MLFHAKRKRLARSPAARRRLKAVAVSSSLILLGAIGYAGYLVAAGSLAWAQDATQAPDATQTPGADDAGPQPSEAKSVAKPKVALHRTKPRQTARSHAAPPTPRPAQNFAARLEAAGATTCARRVDELADASMQGTTAAADASSWFVAAPNQRAVNVVIAQKFAAASVPYGATDIFATPAPNAKCDALALQVIPSPLPCAQLRQAIASRGKMIAELVGLPLLQDSSGQIMLIPTQANACVLIGMRIAYAP